MTEQQKIIYIDLQSLKKLGLSFSQVDNVITIANQNSENEKEKLDQDRQPLTAHQLAPLETAESNVHQIHEAYPNKSDKSGKGIEVSSTNKIDEQQEQEMFENYFKQGGTGKLRQCLEEHFYNLELLQKLCQDLCINYNSLGGQSTYKTCELAQYLMVRDKLKNLYLYLRNRDLDLLEILIKRIKAFNDSEFEKIVNTPKKYHGKQK